MPPSLFGPFGRACALQTPTQCSAGTYSRCQERQKTLAKTAARAGPALGTSKQTPKHFYLPNCQKIGIWNDSPLIFDYPVGAKSDKKFMRKLPAVGRDQRVTRLSLRRAASDASHLRRCWTSFEGGQIGAPHSYRSSGGGSVFRASPQWLQYNCTCTL